MSACPGQEGKDVALVFAVGPHHCSCHLFIYCVLVGIGLGIEGLHGKHSSGTLDERCMKGLTDGRCVDSDRHDDDFQVGADDILCLQGQCQCQVGMDASFVELVEDNHVDTLEGGIIDEHSGKDAFGENFDACLGRHLVLKSYTIAYRLACWFTYETCHSFGYLSGGEASGFQHEDFPLAVHSFEDGERQQGRLAGSWRGCDNKISRLSQGLIDGVGYAECWQVAGQGIDSRIICHEWSESYRGDGYLMYFRICLLFLPFLAGRGMNPSVSPVLSVMASKTAAAYMSSFCLASSAWMASSS